MSQHRVLVVDDDPSLRQLLRLTLPVEEYRIFEAEDGQKALELVDQFEPDLVVLDWKMPQRSGEEVLAELKSFHPRLPVVVLTAGIQARHRMVAESLGADVFLTKPFSPLQLIQTIEGYLPPREEETPAGETTTDAQR